MLEDSKIWLFKIMFILIANEVYKHFWPLVFWWALKLQSALDHTVNIFDWGFLFNVYESSFYLCRVFKAYFINNLNIFTHSHFSN